MLKKILRSVPVPLRASFKKKADQSDIPSPFRANNVIFIHVPKAAGSTINLSLFGYRIGHRPVESYWKRDPKFTQSAFKFAFVRHPYFRFVSAYKYLINGGMSSRDASYQNKYPSEFISLRAFAEACEDSNFRSSIIHLWPQSSFVSIPSKGYNKVFMDFIGKTEFFNDHIEVLHSFIPDSIGMQLLRAKQHKVNVGVKKQLVIDGDIFRKIRTIYENDFEHFGYDEWGTPEKAQLLLSSGKN